MIDKSNFDTSYRPHFAPHALALPICVDMYLVPGIWTVHEVVQVFNAKITWSGFSAVHTWLVSSSISVHHKKRWDLSAG